MEHPCAKCGAAVEDGVPFCKECRAPQIRVVGVEPPPVVVPEVPAVAGEPAVFPAQFLPKTQSARIQWSQALPCAAMGGALSLLLVFPLAVLGAGSALAPFAVFGIAFMGGGAWAVRLYYRKMKDAPVTTGGGAQVGAASGGFGFLFLAVMVVAMVFYQADEMRKLLTESAPQLISRGYDAEKMQQMLDLLKTPGGLVFFVAFGLFAMFVTFVVGSSIGGAWYGAWIRKRTRR